MTKEIPLGLNNPNVTIFKDLLKPNSESKIVPLNEAIQRIREGYSKELINKIRSGDKNSKTKLPSILFQGEFSQRKADGLQKHSGLMVLDFDKIETEEFEEIKNKINSNHHIRASFVSPSGNGIKAIVRVPNNLTKETHSQYYKAFREEFNFEYLDASGSDVARVCFESYDPNIYVNNQAKVYQAKLKELKPQQSPGVIIKADENETIEGIMNFKWEGSFTEGLKNSHVFNLSRMLCEYGVTQAAAESYIMNNIVNGNCKKPQEKLKTIRSAYKGGFFGSKIYENRSKKSEIKRQIASGTSFQKIASENNIPIEDVAKIEKEEIIFWYLEKEKIKINAYKFGEFLKRNGFFKYYAEKTNNPTLIKIDNNIVEESSPSRIKDFVTTYLKKELQVLERILTYPYLTSETFFMLVLETIKIETLRDTKNKSFIPYQNGILEITKDSKNLVPYSNFGKYIWREQILPRNFTDHEDNSNDYKTFLFNISNETPAPLESVLGYLISTYKNKSNNKAIILNDEVISDVSNGGTGKGLFMQGLAKMRKQTLLDGKSFDDKKTFKFQTVNRDTQVLFFDDVQKNFNLENKYSIITEGLEIERKNKDAIRLSVEESPKIVISTNYVIQGDGNSHHRRVHEVEISSYYGKHLTPEDEFNRQLFEDWNSNDFERFDNYMIYCLQKYLIHGLIQEKPKNLELRKLIAASNKDFVDFMEDNNIPIGEKIQTELAFNNFKDECKDFDNKHFSRKKFIMWMKKYCDYKGLEYNSLKSGSIRYILLKNKNKEEKNVDLSEIPF